MRTAITLLVVSSLSACSSISSMQVVQEVKSDGLVYHLPKRDFLVTVTREANKPPVVALSVTEPYGDLSTTYVVEHNSHLLAKNKLTVNVNEAGLLSTSKATTTIDLDGVAKAIGGLGGRTRASIVKSPIEKSAKLPECMAVGSHVFVIQVPGEDIPVCRPGPNADPITVSIRPLWATTPIKVETRTSPGTRDSGLFYRMNRPYLMAAAGPEVNAASLVMSPSESQTYFLPVTRGLFTTNDADFTFAQGIPTKYEQETDGELLALFKLPAKVLEEYFNAVGAALGKSKENDDKRTAALTASLKLEIEKKRVEACLEAIRTKNDTAFKDLKCGD